jgi:hypothetical protein
MPFYTGRTAKLKLANNEVAKVRDWSLDVSADMLETTVLGDLVKGYVPGISSINGSATLSYYTGSSTGVVQLLENIVTSNGITEDNEIELTFEIGPEQYFVGSGFINNASISSSTNELTSVAFQFTMNGPLTTIVTTGTA